jgi:hypothetical protein
MPNERFWQQLRVAQDRARSKANRTGESQSVYVNSRSIWIRKASARYKHKSPVIVVQPHTDWCLRLGRWVKDRRSAP